MGVTSLCQAVELLIEAFGNGAYDVQGGTALLLGEIGDSRAVEPLIEVLRDEVWIARVSAAEALDKIKDSKQKNREPAT